MQVFRLVNGGFVDRLIAFRDLPERLLNGVRTRDLAGMRRHWGRWLEDNGCVRDVFKTVTEVLPDRNLKVLKEVIGKEPCFFILEYKDLNADKDRWREICEFLRQTVDTTVHLKEKIEDMAIAMAPNSHVEISIDPEDVPILEIPEEEKKEPEIKAPTIKEEILTQTGDVVSAPKKRGRPKKVAVEA